ncbi:hypothetical protein FPQ18DRAFT_334278, partial [Pyronema domesticum]
MHMTSVYLHRLSLPAIIVVSSAVGGRCSPRPQTLTQPEKPFGANLGNQGNQGEASAPSVRLVKSVKSVSRSGLRRRGLDVWGCCLARRLGRLKIAGNGGGEVLFVYL